MEIKKTIIACGNAKIHRTFTALNLSFFLQPIKQHLHEFLISFIIGKCSAPEI